MLDFLIAIGYNDIMLVSHESPISILEESKTYNDYDYALVHLFEEYPEYYNFFVESLKQGREVILDNSIFELGVAFEQQEFAKWIEKLNPTFYIVPDVLEDADATMHSFEMWNKDFSDMRGLKIGAVQGKNYRELVECYRYMVTNADLIAISFDYSYYDITGYGSIKEQRWMDGRKKFITAPIND